MTEMPLVIGALAVATLSVRLLGVAVGRKLPQGGAWARALNALPGCLIVSLVVVMMLAGGPREWLAGLVALGVAVWTKNLPLTMGIGIAAIWILRQIG